MSGRSIIQGNHVALRPPQNGDFVLLSDLRNDLSLQRQLMIEPGRQTPTQVREWIGRRNQDPQGVFFVVDADGPCGFVQLTQIDRRRGASDLGICLARTARGKGVATEALGLLESFARRKLRCKKFTLRVLRINHRAIAFYHKVGFQEVELLRRHHLDGKSWRDVVRMEKRLK
jgi:diamine N-acetyltransferase|tara:strand:+ start:1147 stop:1665 length:519 start_codon:yes stop_codon:yes gene_type:complete